MIVSSLRSFASQEARRDGSVSKDHPGRFSAKLLFLYGLSLILLGTSMTGSSPMLRPLMAGHHRSHLDPNQRRRASTSTDNNSFHNAQEAKLMKVSESKENMPSAYRDQLLMNNPNTGKTTVVSNSAGPSSAYDNFPSVHVENKNSTKKMSPLEELKQKQYVANIPARKQPDSPPSSKSPRDVIIEEMHRLTPKNLTAVIHIGPMKTGSSAIQTMFTRVEDAMAQDNYDIADRYWKRDYDRDPFNFLGCFLKNGERRLRAKVDQTHRNLESGCIDDTLQTVLDIAKRQRNILISAEYFSTPERDMKALREFLRPWKNVEVIAFYRRYYDWVISFTNQIQKSRPFADRVPVIEFVKQRMESDQDPLDGSYTLGSVNRMMEHFDNVKVYNMHTIPDGDIREEFYCNALPNAPNTCRKVLEKKEKGFKLSNPSVPLVYENLAYYAKEIGLWSYGNGLTLQEVAFLVEEHQETVLGLSQYDLDGKICPGEEMISWLREKSWEAENQLFPSYFKKQGKKEITEGIEKVRYTKLCHFDVMEILKDPKWQRFFKNL